jgi:hypothetical protein
MKAKDRRRGDFVEVPLRSARFELPIDCGAIDPRSAVKYLEEMDRLLERSRRSTRPRKDDYRIHFDF